MSDYVTIANMAAARIGTETRISSPDDDRFVARTIKAAWDIQRQAAIRDGWMHANLAPRPYPAGTWGPGSAVTLTERHGHSWRE